MKRFVLILSVILAIAAFPVHAYQAVTPATGETVTMFKVAVTSTTASVLTNYGNSKNRVVCRNSGNLEVYLGTSSVVTAQHANSYEMGASTTNAGSMFDTSNKAQLWAISRAGSSSLAATSVNVYCTEERY